MPSESEIIEALQMGMFYTADAINETGDAAFTITYQFEDSAPSDDFSGLTGWSDWSNGEKQAVLAALTLIETFLNVDFVEVSGDSDADLSLGLTTMPTGVAGLGGASLATWSDGSFYDYDAFAAFDKTLDITENLSLILHELGHALGLDHPFDNVTLDADYDTNHYTLMSYDSDPESGEDNDAMMFYDVLALQDIWGAAAFNTGNTTYTGPRTDNVDTIWDTGGTDTFDATANGNDVTLFLKEGKFSTFGSFEDVAIAFGVTIENAIGGSGNDLLIGNDGANELLGGAGGDVLRGNGGKDVLKGGVGADKIKGGNSNDKLNGGSGTDKLYGGSGADQLKGGSGTDKLWGEGGTDTFIFLSWSDTDVIKDFEDDVDTLRIVGMGSEAEVRALAEEVDGDTIFDFGGGEILQVKNMTMDALEDDLVIV